MNTNLLVVKGSRKAGVVVKSKVRAGGITENHSATKAGIVIKSKVRAGGITENHSATRI